MFLLLLPLVGELLIPFAIGGSVLAAHVAGDAYHAKRVEDKKNKKVAK